MLSLLDAQAVEEVRGRPLALFDLAAAEAGDLVELPSDGATRLVVVKDPHAVRDILTAEAGRYQKHKSDHELVRALFGDGLLTSEGARWREQRRLAQRAVSGPALEHYVAAFARAGEALAEEWARAGTVDDCFTRLREATLEGLIAGLFGRAVDLDLGRLALALDRVIRATASERHTFAAAVVETEKRAFPEVEDALACVREAVWRLVEDRRRRPPPPDAPDLLGEILAAAAVEGGDRRVREEVGTLFVAGHETTALTVTWTLHHLARAPAVAADVRAQLRSTLRGAPPAPADLPALPLLRAVIDESLRLTPPVYVMARTALVDVQVLGHPFARGTNFYLSPWVLHHDARWFPEPDRFDPYRWTAGGGRARGDAFLPFGAGARGCVGERFARLEASVLVATLLGRLRPRPGGADRVGLEAFLTTRPAEPVGLRAESW